MASIADNLIFEISKFLYKNAEKEVTMLIGVQDEIAKLRETIMGIRDVLEDAERRRIEDKSINEWLKELKDVMYDADDILDECLIEAEKRKAPSTSSGLLVSCLPPWLHRPLFTHDIGIRMRNLNIRLKNISEQKSHFHLNDISLPHENKATSGTSRGSSPVVNIDIVGKRIEEDTLTIVEFLTRKDEREKVIVVGIVGIGGIGKTTLAQKVYKSSSVQTAFPLRIWINVSKIYNEVELLHEIMASMGIEYKGPLTRALLEPMIEEAIKDKKFLVVLDNVWDASVWNSLLKSPLQNGMTGSRILVTTRSKEITDQMKAVRCLPVEPLSREDGWLLLCKILVLGGNESELLWLKGIAMQIVDKCAGLPLAVRTIGGVLCSTKRSKQAWEEVLMRSEWSSTKLPEEVHNALYLSYEDLPTHLKQCFLYASLFPPREMLQKRLLYSCWISEGLIKVSGNSTLEAEAEDCYYKLIRRGLLQSDLQYTDGWICRMHDLLRLLAHTLAQGENLFIKTVLFNSTTHHHAALKLRRLYVDYKDANNVSLEASKVSDYIKDCNSLRSLFLDSAKVDEECIHHIFKHSRRLRILQLFNASINYIPTSVQNLKHLRYLLLKKVTARNLPGSIGDLVNLQYLFFFSCKNLHILPQSIVKLHNLRVIYLSNTELEQVPAGLQNLKNLRELWGFSVNHGDVLPQQNESEYWCSLGDLAHLPQLRLLKILHLERAKVSDQGRKMESIFKNNNCLEQLRIEATAPAIMDKESIENVLEFMLSPPNCLDSLMIKGYFGSRFPTWMSQNHLSNLSFMYLMNCNYCIHLPSLGMLPNLKHLKIEGASAVTAIGPEFFDHPKASSGLLPKVFPQLRYLELRNMANWSSWDLNEEEGRDHGFKMFPKLWELIIDGCSSLRLLPSTFYSHARALTYMTVANSSLEELGQLPSLRELHANGDNNLHIVSNLPKLEKLYLDSTSMNSLPQWLLGRRKDFPTLRMVIMNDGAITSQLERCHCDNCPEWPVCTHDQLT